jgi:hypothetical protein
LAEADGAPGPNNSVVKGRMTDIEWKVLIALVLVVDRYLDAYGDEVDSRSMRAGENQAPSGAIRSMAVPGGMPND